MIFGIVLGLYSTNTTTMKRTIHFLSLFFIGLLVSSCYTEVIIEDDFIEESPVNTALVLESFDLWYVDINASNVRASVPFLQNAFTVSFNRGVLFANNNLVGIGRTGNGIGIDVGSYGTLAGAVEINHDLDGRWILEVYALNSDTIELYDANSDSSYVLRGHYTNTIDYTGIFYDNIHLFLQEYRAWEKSFTSEVGALNDFDDENYLRFVSGNGRGTFESSIDAVGLAPGQIQWDYVGNYEVFDVANDETLKTLTLDYDFLGNDYFELYVINDGTIELYHVPSGTTYEFRGRGYQQFLKGDGKQGKPRIKSANATMKVKAQKKM